MRIEKHFHDTKMQLQKKIEKDKKSPALLQGFKTLIIMDGNDYAPETEGEGEVEPEPESSKSSMELE